MRVRAGLLVSVAVVLLALAGAAAAGEAPVEITVAPDPVRILRRDGVQQVNFDFLVRNRGSDTLEIRTVRLLAFDRTGALVTRREINGLGMCPSISTLPNVEIGPGKTVIVFNPFHELPAGMELKTLRYVFAFAPRGGEVLSRAEVTVHPVPSETKTALSLPLRGKVFVYDGHDFYSHHRRLDLANPFVVQLGIRHNITRYGLDFMQMDSSGSTHRGSGEQLEDYYVFGRPVLAPAAGTVVDCIDGRPDSPIGKWLVDYEELQRTRDLRLLGGNFIVIDHGSGEFSLLAHLRSGSIQVRKGDHVVTGQTIAAVGNSGDSGEPHLHYQLRSRPEPDCEGIPAVFHNFRRYHGSRAVTVSSGDVDTGDVVEGS